MKRHFSSQYTLILIIIAVVFLLSGNSMAGEKQSGGGDLKDIQISEIAIDPANTNTLYIGTQQGAFKSTDGGNNWVVSK